MDPLTKWEAEDAAVSLGEALDRVPRKKRESLKARLVALIERKLANQQLSDGTWEQEGKLPQSAGAFYAIRKLPLRCYCWVEGGVLCISHYIYKDRQKLDEADTQRVHRAWWEHQRYLNRRGKFQ